jgi:hypothetical protein
MLAPAGGAEEKLAASDAQIDRLIAEAPARKVAVAADARPVAEKLSAHVTQMAALDHLAPLWYFNGSQAMWMFAQPRETLESLAPALAVLDGKPREAALAFLDRELEKYPPLGKPFYPVEGLRRFPFNAGPETRKGPASAPSQPAAVFAAYGLWAYAHYGDRSDKVTAEWPAVRGAFQEYMKKPTDFKFNWNRDNESQLNRAASAMIGVARLARLAKDEETYQAARKELARLVAARLPLEKHAGMAHIVGNGVALARYWDLAPEVGRLIQELADKERQQKWINLNTHLIPDWHLAWAERPTGVMNPPGDEGKCPGEYIGSEYFLSNPMFAMSQFAAKALVLRDDGPSLAKYLDMPWCRADLYYVAKCTWTLRAYDGWKFEKIQ